MIFLVCMSSSEGILNKGSTSIFMAMCFRVCIDGSMLVRLGHSVCLRLEWSEKIELDDQYNKVIDIVH